MTLQIVIWPLGVKVWLPTTNADTVFAVAIELPMMASGAGACEVDAGRSFQR